MMMRGLYDACLLGEREKRFIEGGGGGGEEEEDIWLLRGKRRDILDVSCSLPTLPMVFDLKKIGRT